jgi:hypothetical protein
MRMKGGMMNTYNAENFEREENYAEFVIQVVLCYRSLF